MIESFIIAESGGTKTDWVLIQNGLIIDRRTTESYHPIRLDDDFRERMLEDWKQFTSWVGLPLYFFGAGCFNDSGRQVALSMLSEVFQHIYVRSDLDAAAIALYGNRPGYFAILGTGSVFAHWDGSSITSIKGGLGYQEGDEGSGYYFGKLVLQAAQSGMLTDRQNCELFEVHTEDIPDFSAPTSIDRNAVASLSVKLSGNMHFEKFHAENIELFFERYIDLTEENTALGIVGSYGFHHRDWVNEIAVERGITINRFIERPIDNLVEQSACFIE